MFKSSITAALSILALSGCTMPPETADTFAGCDSYGSAREAQNAWERSGRPARYDGDSDGQVCEGSRKASRPTARTSDCSTPTQPVVLSFSRREYPNVTDHIEDAQREGYPHIMRIEREGAARRRDVLLDGIPTRGGMDRDEYPPAVGRTSSTAGDASVRYVPSSENRSHGSDMGNQLSPYCDGTRFRMKVTP